MRSWATLTPQQRQAAREQYKTLRQLPPEKKDAVRQRWQEYQNLPPEQKRELAAHPPVAPGPAPGATSRTPAQAIKPPGAAAPVAPPSGDMNRTR